MGDGNSSTGGGKSEASTRISKGKFCARAKVTAGVWPIELCSEIAGGCATSGLSFEKWDWKPPESNCQPTNKSGTEQGKYGEALAKPVPKRASSLRLTALNLAEGDWSDPRKPKSRCPAEGAEWAVSLDRAKRDGVEGASDGTENLNGYPANYNRVTPVLA